MICLRLFNFLYLALAGDPIRFIHGGSPSTAGSCGATGWLAAVGGTARALVMLLIPVAWLPGSLGSAMGMQLPPLQHLALHGLSLLLLAHRTPAGRHARGWLGHLCWPYTISMPPVRALAGWLVPLQRQPAVSCRVIHAHTRFAMALCGMGCPASTEPPLPMFPSNLLCSM